MTPVSISIPDGDPVRHFAKPFQPSTRCNDTHNPSAEIPGTVASLTIDEMNWGSIDLRHDPASFSPGLMVVKSDIQKVVPNDGIEPSSLSGNLRGTIRLDEVGVGTTRIHVGER